MMLGRDCDLKILTVNQGLDYGELSDAIFSGFVVKFQSMDTTAHLLDCAVSLLKSCLSDYGYRGPLDNCEHHLDKNSYNRAIGQAAKSVRYDEDIKSAFLAAFRSYGLKDNDLFGDIRKLRRLPSRRDFWGKRTRSLPPHRDSWGSNISAQVNWWMPMTDVCEGSGVLFYPRYFDRNIANNSFSWDLYQLMDAIRCGRGDEYPLIPALLEEPDCETAFVAMKPGDMIAFSAAHLHASAPNKTGKTRFNLETRTVSLDHIRKGKGARNLDGRSPHIGWSLFRSYDNEECLSPELVLKNHWR